ncbi:hypothetical protein [Cellulomonas sp. P24]|uniref:hypothetical protein n=1 Tax=Cellulomonas sp. P24 TaxID=2885206 RepID=UPI00216AEAB0|nr:hypothetical protein [Cellulomonas sp. P24]MCR6492856.1 hypothetical protein [Cellulomonas sp. P24]
MRCRIVAAAIVTVGCLATSGCVQATTTSDASATDPAATSSPAPRSATTDGTDRAQSANGVPGAAEFWAEEAEIRAAAIEYNDLDRSSPEFSVAWAAGPDCAPYTWMADLIRGDLSYDDVTLRSTWAFWDKARLPQNGDELCDGGPTQDPQLFALLSTMYLDAASPDVKREAWSYWKEGTEQVEESYQFTKSAEEYRSLTKKLKAARAGVRIN